MTSFWSVIPIDPKLLLAALPESKVALTRRYISVGLR
jgi:hypothetical protein